MGGASVSTPRSTTPDPAALAPTASAALPAPTASPSPPPARPPLARGSAGSTSSAALRRLSWMATWRAVSSHRHTSCVSADAAADPAASPPSPSCNGGPKRSNLKVSPLTTSSTDDAAAAAAEAAAAEAAGSSSDANPSAPSAAVGAGGGFVSCNSPR